MSRFTVYMDKENNSSGISVVNPSLNNIRPIQAGKTFGASSTTHLRHRRALGDVNTTDRSRISSQAKKRNVTNNTAIAQLSKLSLKEECRDHINNNVKESVKLEKIQLSEKISAIDEEIEQMFPYDEIKEDNYEDIWPTAERPSEFIHKFNDWRPDTIFSRFKSPLCAEEPGDSSDEELFREPDSDPDEEERIQLEDITLPELDFSQAHLNDIFAKLVP